MVIKLENGTLFFNDISIKRPIDIDTAVKSVARIKHLDNNTELSIVDNMGIRYWTSKQNFVEIQICINEDRKNDFFPLKNYSNLITLNSIQIGCKTIVDDEFITNMELFQDYDNLKYGVLTYSFKRKESMCSLTLNNDKRIKHISIVF